MQGVTINIDGRALSHDLLPIGIGIAGPNTFLSRAIVNQLTVIPGSGYGFQPGSGIVRTCSTALGKTARSSSIRSSRRSPAPAATP